MIQFLRKIRLGLLLEGDSMKYFKYAVGEIFLVVIGILIALQINNWNEKRKRKLEERILLTAVLKNLKLDSTSIANIRANKDRILGVHKDLIAFVEGKNNSKDINIGEVRRSLPAPLTTKANHPDLQNQVLDERVKSEVLNYFRMVNQFEFIMSNYNDILDEELRPFLREKHLLNFGKQFGGLSEFINRTLFLKELEKPELQQLLFNVGVKLNLVTVFSDNWVKRNNDLKEVITSYLQKP